MGVESAMDVDVFFNPNEFGKSATYKGATINGLLEAGYLPDAAGMLRKSAAFTGKTSDLSAAKKGDTLTIGSTVYTVIEVEPSDDGTTTKLIMER